MAALIPGEACVAQQFQPMRRRLPAQQLRRTLAHTIFMLTTHNHLLSEFRLSWHGAPELKGVNEKGKVFLTVFIVSRKLLNDKR